MSQLILPRRFYHQPQGAVEVDWSNPLTQGLVGAYDQNGYNAATRTLATNVTAPLKATPIGLGRVFANGAEVEQCDGFIPSATAFTAITHFVPNFASTSNTRQGIWHLQATAGSVQNRLRLIWLNATYGFYLDTKDGFAYNFVPSFAAGDILTVGFVKNPGDVQQYFYFNGLRLSASRAAYVSDAGTPTAKTPMWLGDDVEQSTGWRLNGTIVSHLHFNGALNEGEVKALSSNPWQLFKPRREVLYFTTGSVTIPTLSSPSVTNILTTSATPQVTLTF